MGGRIKRTVTSMPLKGKVVLVRADLDAPLVRGQADMAYIQKAVPTLKYLLRHHAKVIVIGHLLRPDTADTAFSLRPVATALANVLGVPVRFVDQTIGPKAKMAIKRAPYGSVIVLENLRFHKGEERNDRAFAKALVQTTGADYFVQDDRRASQHAAASTVALAHVVPGFAGFQVLDVWDGPGVKSLLDA